jgi:uncharacterized radical SAM superfamily protein
MVIYPKPNEYKKPRFGFSYTWAMIGTILQESGHKVVLHDFSCEEFDSNIFFSQLMNEKIQLVLMEFDSFALKRSENDEHGKSLVQSIKAKHPGIMVIAYGYYCCITGNNIPSADVTIKQNDINLVLSAIHRLFQNFPLKQFDNFDTFPFINRSLINTISFFENKNSTLVQTAKGCENSCVFCQRKGWQSHYVAHSNEYVLREFEDLCSHNFKNIWIIDENFTFHLQRAKNILTGLVNRGLTQNMKISISSWANIDEDFLLLAVKANIKIISFGIETGNNEILQFYRKNIDLNKAKAAIKYADSIGIFTVGNFIIGAPKETHETIDETFSFINECKFDEIHIKTLDYMIGSELYSGLSNALATGKTHIFACKENGGLNNFSLEDIKQIRKEFLDQYYKDNQQRIIQKVSRYGTPFD